MKASISFPGMLLVAFIVLKLCDVISWSWWWVLAPAWLPIALLVVVVGVFVTARLTGEIITMVVVGVFAALRIIQGTITKKGKT